MNSLFPSEKIVFDVPNAIIEYYPNFFEETQAKFFFDKLYQEIPWQQDAITVFGNDHDARSFGSGFYDIGAYHAVAFSQSDSSDTHGASAHFTNV